MIGALQGFWVITGIALLGYVTARAGLFDEAAQVALSRFAFFVASPCLLLAVLAHTPIGEVFSAHLLVSVLSVVVTCVVYLVVARPRWPQDLGGSVIACLCAAYVNAGNLGIPIAMYVLGNVKYMAPTLLLQQILLTPLAMTLMDVDALGRRPSPVDVVVRLTRNPMTVAAMSGVVLSVVGAYPPASVMRPVEVIGQAAVPAMLFAFGVSLHVGPRPGASGSAPHVAWLAACKLAVQPASAALLGTAFGLHGKGLLVSVVTASLPTAQNVFTHAVRYQRGTLLARDVVLVTTVLSFPVILVLSALFGG